MRHLLARVPTAAAIAGLATAARAESVMSVCASQWKQAQAARATSGEI